METVDKKNRIWLWDNLKCFLIFCVVFGHFSDMFEDQIPMLKSIFLFVNVFHMPLFIYIFGLFAKSTVFKGKGFREKILYYFLLYVILKLLITVCQIPLGGKMSFAFFEDRGTQWYLLALVLFLLAGQFFKKLKPVYGILLSVFIACISGYDSRVGTFFSLGRLINFMPFFLLGLYFDPQKIVALVRKPLYKFLGFAVMAGLAGLCLLKLDDIYWIRPLLTGANSYTSLPHPAYGFMIRGCYYIALFIIGLSLIACMPSSRKIFSPVGQRTLQIYFWHRPLLYLMAPYISILETVFGSFWWIAFLCVAVILTVFLSVPLFGKPLEWLRRHCSNCWVKNE